MAGEKNRSLIMKLLRDHRGLREPEDLARTHDGVERPEAGAITIDSFRGNAGLQQTVAHLRGFVVISSAVVAADQQIVDFACMKKRGSRSDACIEKWIIAAVAKLLVTSQKQPDGSMRNQCDVRKSFALCGAPYQGWRGE